MEITDFINELLKITREKKIYLMKMLDYTKKQTDVINNEDLAILDELINEKQKIIDTINVLDTDFEIAFGKIKDQMQVKNLSDVMKSKNEKLDELKKEIQDVVEYIKEIRNQEKLNFNKLSEKKEEIAKKMKGITEGKVASKKYSGEPMVPPNPAFFDKKK
ncbi:MAG: flagellar export chaperone FlgN [Deltaproteobacteria bacterium]